MRYYELKMTEEELRSFSDYLEELRYFADDDRPRKKESHWLRNTAIGATAAAGALYAGNKGWLGRGMQRFSGNTIASAGSLFGSRSLTAYGNRGVANANYGRAMDKLKQNISGWESQQKAGTLTAENAQKLANARKAQERMSDSKYKENYLQKQTTYLTDKKMQTGRFTPKDATANQAAQQQAVVQQQAAEQQQAAQ